MKVINDNRYLNKSLEPVLVEFNKEAKKYDTDFVAKRLNGKQYLINSMGESLYFKKSIVKNVHIDAMFDDENVSYIDDMFEIIYCNNNGDWFNMSDLLYGFKMINIHSIDIRFAIKETKKSTAIGKLNKKIRKDFALKYSLLREALCK